MNLLKDVKTFDGGLKRKQKKASRNSKFLAEVLAGQGASWSCRACQIRRGDGAEILSGFRHIVLNLLKNDTSFKGSIQRKMKCAAMSSEYMEKVLDGSPLLTSENGKA